MTEKEIFLYALRRVVQKKYAEMYPDNDLPYEYYKSFERDFFWTDEEGNVFVQGNDCDAIVGFKFNDNGILIDFY